MKSNAVRAALAAATTCTVLLAGACEPKVDPQITHLAEFYAERFADSMSTDTLGDSAAVAARQAEVDSLTVDWTPDDWTDFWAEVERLRKR